MKKSILTTMLLLSLALCLALTACTPAADGPESTPADTPAETPFDTPLETPAETPVETPIETPAETPSENETILNIITDLYNSSTVYKAPFRSIVYIGEFEKGHAVIIEHDAETSWATGGTMYPVGDYVFNMYRQYKHIFIYDGTGITELAAAYENSLISAEELAEIHAYWLEYIDSETQETPAETPDVNKPVTFPEELPNADKELTEAQRTQIKEKFGNDIDWDKHYLGTYKGYVIFGAVDGTEIYCRINKSSIMLQFGFVNGVYAYKDGEVSELKSLSDNNIFDLHEMATLARISLEKTIGELPSFEALTAEEIASVEAVAECILVEGAYLGKYNGYIVIGRTNLLDQNYIVSIDSRKYDFGQYGDVVMIKDGELINIKDAYENGLISKDDAITAAFVGSIHYFNMVLNLEDNGL